MKKQLQATADLLEPQPKAAITPQKAAPTEATHYWNECLAIIKDNIDAQAYSTWFQPLVPLYYCDSRLTIQVPSQLFQEWIDENYYDLLQKTIKRVLGPSGELIYDVIIIQIADIEPAKIQYPALAHPPASHHAASTDSHHHSNLYPPFNFDNFIVGDSNRLAVNAAKAVAKEVDSARFNPYIIHGASGLGKTHLAHAIGNYITQNNPKKRCLYVSSEKFTMDFVDQATSNDNKKKTDFNNTYRNVDVLIVDDIQFLSSKNQTQEKFFNIFNQLKLAGKQIVLTSDRHSRDLKDIDNRLASRFIGGLNVEITPPDFYHRKDIILYKTKTEGINLTEDIINYIASYVNKSIREIEGTLIKIVAVKTLENKHLTLELVQEIVKGLNSAPQHITMDEVINKVCSYYNIKSNLLETKTRKQEVALARQMAMFLIRKHIDTSLKTIGARFGGRDHATVIHSCRVIENYLDTNKKIKEQYEFIDAILNSA